MKRDEKIVLAIIPIVIVAALLIPASTHFSRERRALQRYSEEIRPEVAAAVEAYRTEHGSYPTDLTNAIDGYYHGLDQSPSFWEFYGYQNRGTNFYLRHFGNFPPKTPDSMH